MSEFKREERYVVFKLKGLSETQWRALGAIQRDYGLKRVDCVVVESDWPEYEKVWEMIEARMAAQGEKK